MRLRKKFCFCLHKFLDKTNKPSLGTVKFECFYMQYDVMYDNIGYFCVLILSHDLSRLVNPIAWLRARIFYKRAHPSGHLGYVWSIFLSSAGHKGSSNFNLSFFHTKKICIQERDSSPWPPPWCSSRDWFSKPLDHHGSLPVIAFKLSWKPRKWTRPSNLNPDLLTAISN